MSSQARIVSGFAFMPVGDTAVKACSGRVYSSLRFARIARFRLRSSLFGVDRLQIWTCTVEYGDGFQHVRLLELVE
jgi:hypothetical protein